jgi:BirA family biotin operon repressor/biotin-[acetyl-CoA-carboxylase] ligase
MWRLTISMLRAVPDDSNHGAEEPRFGALADTRFFDVRWFDEVGSTNTDLMLEASGGAAEGTVFIADLQTAGRGRRGRDWTAPAGTSLMMSVLLRPPLADLDTQGAALVTTAFALAAASACRDLTGVKVVTKWPNDLVVIPDDGPVVPGDPGYRKIAGILTESVIRGDNIEAMVVGMGMNTGWTEVPEHLQLSAASLNLLSGDVVDRVRLARSILERFDDRYTQLLGEDGASAIARDMNLACATVGQRVRITISDHESLIGLAKEIDPQGRLVVLDEAGVERRVVVGDVVHVRPELSEH